MMTQFTRRARKEHTPNQFSIGVLVCLPAAPRTLGIIYISFDSRAKPNDSSAFGFYFLDISIKQFCECYTRTSSETPLGCLQMVDSVAKECDSCTR